MYYFHVILSPSQISDLVLSALPVRMQKHSARTGGKGLLQGATGDAREGFLYTKALGAFLQVPSGLYHLRETNS